MNILAIGAHFDDVELGCGGSLFAFKNQGHTLNIFTASSSGYSDPQGRLVRSNDIAREEGKKAAQYLDARLIEGNFPTFELEFAEPLNCALMDVLSTTRPDIVFTHWPGDVHHDHRALGLASLQCCRHIPRVLTYCSNWYEGGRHFEPRFFIDISAYLENKIHLISLYQSENRRTDGCWEEYARNQARLMGLKMGVRFAESFEVVKWLMP